MKVYLSLPNVTLEYAHIYKPAALNRKNPEDKRYMAYITFEKSNASLYAALNTAIDSIQKNAFSGHRLTTCISDGDEHEDARFAGKYMVWACGHTKPAILCEMPSSSDKVTVALSFYTVSFDHPKITHIRSEILAVQKTN